MEHLILATAGRLTEHDVVPFVATGDHKRIPFSEFLTTEWPSMGMEWCLAATSEEKASLVQTWFFFGTFQQILGSFFTATDYVVDDPGRDEGSRKIMTTKSLTPTLQAWAEFARHNLNGDEQRPLYRMLFAEFGVDGTGLGGLLDSNDMHRAVSISIKSSLNLLLNAIKLAFDTEMGLGGDLQLNELPQVDLEIMRRNGWCPSVAVRCWNKFDVTGQMMLRSAPNLASGPDQHSLCTTELSRCARIDTSTFGPQHAESGCKCSMWSAGRKSLERIIARNNLPLVQFTVPEPGTTGANSPNQLRIALVSSNGDIPYIALSHVWAHGLGNSKENALPRCQLQKLMFKLISFYESVADDADSDSIASADMTNLIRDDANMDSAKKILSRAGISKQQLLSGSRKIHIWLDTLCCPARAGYTKKLTLSRMRQIYADASDVLVLDKALELLDSEVRPAWEVAMYVCTSNWSQRVWTLQEGSIAKRLWFKFRDAVINAEWLIFQLSQLRNKLLPLGAVGASDDLYWEMRLLLGGHYKGLPIDVDQKWNLHWIIRALINRSLSIMSDEACILLNLVGSNEASPLTDGSKVESRKCKPYPKQLIKNLIQRLRHGEETADTDLLVEGDYSANITKFWDICLRKKLIEPIIIFNKLPKLDIAHYRWAPKSFLYDNHRQSIGYAVLGALTHNTDDDEGQRCEKDKEGRGLIVPNSGYIIDSPSSTRLQQQMELLLTAKEPQHQKLTFFDATSGVWSHLYLTRAWTSADPATLSNKVSTQLCLVMMNFRATSDSDSGLIVEVLDTGKLESGKLFHYVRICGDCVVTRATSAHQQLFDRLKADPETSPEEVSDELIELGVEALRTTHEPKHKLEEDNAVFIRYYIKHVSQKFIDGQYLTATERLTGKDHRWIVD